MTEIKISNLDDDQVEYSMQSNSAGYFADPKIIVKVEHGCLCLITLPQMSVDGQYWAGDQQNPQVEETMHVLNRVFKDFNMNYRVMEHYEPIEL